MNLLAITRLTGNILLIAAVLLLTIMMFWGTAIAPFHVIVIGALALLGGVAQFMVSVMRPRDIKPAWDEQSVASHRGSYQFGYWSALIGFWALFLYSRVSNTEVDSSFLWVGVILMGAPSLWMIIATFLGRAG
ncbi:hypothetical protein [Sulfitobacter marinus]|nr:hypothetical protein [Sulfitobacter marinus]